jgi:hypothetical protein
LLIVTIILGILAGLLVVIWFTTVRIEFLIKREHEDDRGEVKISLLGGLIRFRVEIPRINWEGTDEGMGMEGKIEGDTAPASTMKKAGGLKVTRRSVRKASRVIRELYDHIENFQLILRWFLSKVTCEKLVWVTRFGTGDAAEAGVLTGIMWGIKTSLVGWLGRYIRWDHPPHLHIDPEFNRKVLETHFHGIIRFRAGHAILGMKRIWSHLRKGRERKWHQTTPYRA